MTQVSIKKLREIGGNIQFSLAEDVIGGVIYNLVDGGFLINKFGSVDGVTDATDVWSAGGTYTGQPLNFTPETVSIVSTSTADTSAGTGARR